MEGTGEQLQQFNTWLNQCCGQGIFTTYVVNSQVLILFRYYLDQTRPFHPQAHPDGIIRGNWSNNFYEKLSAYSANRYQEGHSRSDPDSDKGSSQSQDQHIPKLPRSERVTRSSSSLISSGKNVVGSKRKL